MLTRLFGATEAGAQGRGNPRLAWQPTTTPKLSDLIDARHGKVRPIVWAGIGLAVFQQLVGINVVFYYGATLWEAVGFTERRRAADQHPVGRGLDRRLPDDDRD